MVSKSRMIWKRTRTTGVYPFPDPPVYPVTARLDTTTHGAWRGKYGKEAFVLFGFDRQQHSNRTVRAE
eukprot:COSAG05_NODE_127_length_17241_cov_7.514817_9_plen_68_part_00